MSMWPLISASGALKITPAHDMNDNQIGIKHGLAVYEILNEDGTLSNDAQLYVGVDRFEARKLIVDELKQAGHVVKIDEYTHQVGFSERTDVVVEPRLSLQWWVDMKKISTPALNAVQDGEINFSSCQIQKPVSALDGKHQRLVHFASALVGASNTCMV